MLHESGLTGTGMSDNADELTFGYDKRNIVESFYGMFGVGIIDLTNVI
jgi:hypothetical protein